MVIAADKRDYSIPLLFAWNILLALGFINNTH